MSTNKQLINAVAQRSYKCAETSELNFFHGHTCIYTTLRFSGKYVIQTNPSNLRERWGGGGGGDRQGGGGETLMLILLI